MRAAPERRTHKCEKDVFSVDRMRDEIPTEKLQMKIIVDVCGGDFPEEVVKGAILSLAEGEGFTIVLAGDPEKIGKTLEGMTYDKARVEILTATEEITCNDEPTVAIRKKTESSLVKALDLLRTDEEAAGLISAGSTGAVLAGGFMKIGRLKGVSRPALAPILPTITGGKVVLCDSGANADCKPVNLCHFAVMAAAYCRAALKVEKPRVALLCNGTEDEKGNFLTKEAFPLIAEVPGIDFKGNMEARDLLSGNYDVVVADGFAGNVALKGTEGGVSAVMTLLKAGIKKSFRAKLGALLLKPVFYDLKKRMDVNGQGGAPLLGLKKPVLKVHGSAKAKAVTGAVLQVKALRDYGMNDRIAEDLARLAPAEEEA